MQYHGCTLENETTDYSLNICSKTEAADGTMNQGNICDESFRESS